LRKNAAHVPARNEDKRFNRRMNVIIHARRDLISARHESIGSAFGAARAVLLEGAWPEANRSHNRLSLDDSIDARFGWVDEEAARLAGLAADDSQRDRKHHSLTAAGINALSLRYYMVKLARVVAFFTEVCPLARGDDVDLVVAGRRDEDYVDLVASLCRLAGSKCRVTRIECPPVPDPSFPPNHPWRRRASRWLGCIEPSIPSNTQPRVVLCGNPRLLDPVCMELARRNCRLWWLYDRFALKTWLRWRPRGVGQLVCQSSLSGENRIGQPQLPPLVCRQVDLTAPVQRWIDDRIRTHGPRQTRIVDQIDVHFLRVKPDALVLDQDATPFARAAIGLARQRGPRSFVVQHGAPLSRFGFAPPAADKILVWGQSSCRTLLRWGVAADRIHVTGSPRHDRLSRTFSPSTRKPSAEAKTRPPKILLLATVPPNDARPDGVELHLTRSTYAKMLHDAFWAADRIPNATLVVKLHPRSPHDPVARRLLAQFDQLRARVVTDGPVEPWIAEADCVLSCISSAGIDATLAGVPVIQLLPEGCGKILPAHEWGLLGSAGDGVEIEQLLARALALEGNPSGPHHDVFHRLDGLSAERIAEAILTSRDSPPSRHNTNRHRRSPAPCSLTTVQ
jgi:hypothetical protein